MIKIKIIDSKKKIENYIIANTFLKRFKGLMLKKDFEKKLIIEIPKNSNKFQSGIHTFFMRFPIEVIFIDENMKIFEKIVLKPWKFYFPKKGAKYIIESKNKTDLKINNIIEFNEN